MKKTLIIENEELTMTIKEFARCLTRNFARTVFNNEEFDEFVQEQNRIINEQNSHFTADPEKWFD